MPASLNLSDIIRWRHWPLALGGLLLFAGLWLLLQGVNAFADYEIRQQKYSYTLGRIVELRPTAGGLYYPRVGFMTLDSQKVFVEVPEAAAPLDEQEVGQTIGLYYDVINPDDTLILPNEEFWRYFPVASGSILLLGGMLLLALALRQRWQLRQLQQRGRRIEARVRSVARDPQQKINGQPAFVIYCEWQAPGATSAWSFQSPPLAEDPRPNLPPDGRIGILVDPEKPENYQMDLSRWE